MTEGGGYCVDLTHIKRVFSPFSWPVECAGAYLILDGYKIYLTNTTILLKNTNSMEMEIVGSGVHALNYLSCGLYFIYVLNSIF